jgi:SAM-dependent methyltransferase
LDYFDSFYRKAKEKNDNDKKAYSKSLLTFFNENVAQFLSKYLLDENFSILDIGCGTYSVFEDLPQLNCNVLAVDFSAEAISQAPNSNIHYQLENITHLKFSSEGKFNLIFDSHCLNCITQEMDRKIALQNLFRALKPGGLFASELMVQPIGKNVEMPHKKIKTARELEEELTVHGFKIQFFMISKDSLFTNEFDGLEVTCDLLRVVAKKEGL